jgi:antitoxin component YwqK of YwqJK toxin-antitoxin module
MKIRYQYDSLSPGIPNGGYEMYIDSTLLISGTFKQGRRHGKWTTYYLRSSNKKRIEGYYVNNRKHHEWKHYGKKGELISEFFFFKGGRVGTWKSYHQNGKAWSKIEYGKVDKPNDVEVWDEEGVLLFKESWTYSGDSTFSDRTIYYTNGEPYEFLQTLNNKYHGEQVTYHPKKVVYERKHFENGKLMEVSESRTWNGQPRESGSIHNGTGSYINYYPDGIKASELQYRSGILSDTATFYHKGGKVSGVVFLEEINGEAMRVYSKSYNKYGIPEVYFEYNSKKDEQFVVYGRKKNFGERRLVTYSGKEMDCTDVYGIEYDANNNRIHEYTMRNGLLHGKRTEYFASGGVMRETNYFNGDMVGSDIVYNKFGKVVEETIYPSFPEETTIDSNWCKLKYDDRSAISSVNFNHVQKNIAWDYHSQPDPLPGQFEENPQLELVKFERKIDIYEDPIILGNLQYPGNFFGFLNFNLGHLDIVKVENLGVVNLIALEVDEMGIIQSHKMLKQDKLGISEGIDELLNVKPIFSPTTMNGFPTNTYKLYFVSF